MADIHNYTFHLDVIPITRLQMLHSDGSASSNADAHASATILNVCFAQPPHYGYLHLGNSQHRPFVKHAPHHYKQHEQTHLSCCFSPHMFHVI